MTTRVFSYTNYCVRKPLNQCPLLQKQTKQTRPKEHQNKQGSDSTGRQFIWQSCAPHQLSGHECHTYNQKDALRCFSHTQTHFKVKVDLAKTDDTWNAIKNQRLEVCLVLYTSQADSYFVESRLLILFVKRPVTMVTTAFHASHLVRSSD